MTTVSTRKKMEYEYVIVGGGIAGVSCIEALSVWAPESSVLLVTSSQIVKAATHSVQITKTLTELKIEEVSVDNIKQKHKRLQVLTDTVSEFDGEKKLLSTAGGHQIKYCKMCICTGARPKMIYADNPFVIGIRDTDSVIDMTQRISTARRIAIVGNGGIASEIVYEVKGVEKVWIIKDDHISKTFIDAGAAEFFKSSLVKSDNKEHCQPVVKRLRYCADGGLDGPALGPDWHSHYHMRGVAETEDITIEYDTSITNISGGQDGYPVRVHLSNDKTYDCDLVISATGVTPNLGPFHSLKLEQDGGISVNWRLETSCPDVFAAGDVCSAAWPWAQHWLQMRLWTQARQMGIFSAQCMACNNTQELLQDFCFEIFSHVTKFFGYKVILLGLFNAQKLGRDHELLVRVTKGHEYVKLVMREGKLQGCVLIGDTDLEEMCENLILNQLDLSSYGEDLLNPDIDIEDYFD